ncbi:hypothetical protein [Salinilacihabitans rarus]|uniref:hypothetical protein n=1 Tax=Salinilacihabitans rarus TaxID=2961596 RepID=UPI0020C8EEC5|nr:hypothetical protein [Salinilacihabitans rarus]
MALDRSFRRDVREASADLGDDSRLVETLVWGVVGGVIATVAMTLYRLPLTRALPPAAPLWAKYAGREGQGPEEYSLLALHLHLLYGASAGAAFALAHERLPPSRSTAPETRATLLGLCYGLALSVVGKRVVLDGLLDEDLDAGETTVFHVGHAIYGLTLGSWIGSREGETGPR